MRVALFGGTFDPPHRGHLGVARAAADAFKLDTILFAPTGQQPLKTGLAITPFLDRFAMVELACTTDPRFTASLIDAPRSDGSPNYTVDTLAALKTQMPETRLFNLVGADSFLSLPHWREPRRLLALAEWIVVSRPGHPLGDLSSLHLSPAELTRVHLLETVHYDLSATSLRQCLSAGESCDDDQLTTDVAAYIRSHGLYRS